MPVKRAHLILALSAAMGLLSCSPAEYDVIVVGGGASGVSAAIQSARLGVNTLVLEETPWLGGMLTSAGVSAIDGNWRLRGGIFGEFVDSLAARYGGYETLGTGWVSHVLFEPQLGAEVFDNITSAEPSLTVLKEMPFEAVSGTEDGWTVKAGGKRFRCKVLIDGTELGDVAKACGAAYEVGNADGVVQDMTYVLTVRDYGPDADRTIPEPDGYDRSLYVNCCENPLNTAENPKGQTLWSPEMMLSYGRLPGGDIMLNWPIDGNDFYAAVVDASESGREAAFAAAKAKALGFLYFIQTELGYRNIGIAEGVYPTEDGLPFYPYFRESRRIDGESRITLASVSDPFASELSRAYRAGIAVGDYPVDHHHYANPDWKNLHSSYSAVPSFTVPAGVMIPKDVDKLIVAEKSISADWDVEGATRLQPVCMELGQAAGTIAASAVLEGCAVRDVSVRKVQTLLLDAGARLQPYLDLEPDDPDFQMLQRIGCTGIIRAEGRSEGWSNEMWMRLNEPLRWCDVHLEGYFPYQYNPSEEVIEAEIMYKAVESVTGEHLGDYYLSDPHRPLTRMDAIRALDTWIHPFETHDVDWNGRFVFRLR